jgi:hypothetical protein
MKRVSQLGIHLRAGALLIFAFTLMPLSGDASAQTFNQDPGHSAFLTVENVKFSCPKDFICTRSRTEGPAIYIAHQEYDLELVVGLASKGADSIEQLARVAASHVFPKQQAPYSWKKLDMTEQVGGERVSKFETGSGGLQGFGGKQRVVFKFRQVRVKDQEVIVGYLFGLGRGSEAKALFERNLAGDSMLGWYAEAHIIASLTGEKYTDINPGTSMVKGIDVPKPRKN